MTGAISGKRLSMSDGERTDVEQEREQAREEVKQLEEDPPQNLEDWPDGKAKYETFGGKEGDHAYNEGPEKNLGPDSLRHHEDGSVTVRGEEADDPDEYKSDPIPGGPTDPDAPDEPGEHGSPRQGGDESDSSEGESS